MLSRIHRRLLPRRLLHRQFPALLLAGILAFSQTALAVETALSEPEDASPALPVIDDGVRPVYDEAYYATTDYYGNLTDGSVVKSYILNGAESLLDYGKYDAVSNLSDGTDPDWQGQEVRFRFGPDAPTHFYFEGKTAAPFAALPWTLSVHYRLNGLAAKAEDLAGKAGLVEIHIDALPNADASEYARNNYILALTTVFNQDDILSLEAPGSQLQLIGNLRTVLFLAFPGEEQHFVIRAGTEEFSFNGITFMMMPATLAQLEDVAKISGRKTDLEDSYHDLSDSLDSLMDAFDGMQESLYKAAGGLDTLNKARQTVSSGKESVYRNADALQGSLSSLSGALDPVSRQVNNASAFVSESRGAVNRLVDSTMKLDGNLGDLETVLNGLESGLSGMEESLTQIEASLAETRTGLEDVESSLSYTRQGLESVEGGLGYTEADLEEVEGALWKTENSLGGVETSLEAVEDGLKRLEKNGDDVKDLLDRAQDLEGSLHTLSNALDDAKLPGTGRKTSSASAEETIASVRQIGQLFQMTAGGAAPNETAFYAAMLEQRGFDSASAGQAAGLFASHNEAAIEASDPDGSLTAAYGQLSRLYQAGEFQTFAASVLQTQGYSAAEAKTTARQMEQIWTIYESGGSDRAALELLLSSMDSITGTVSSVTGSANTTLRDVAVPASDVARDLADLTADLDALITTVESAQKLSEEIRDASGTLRTASGALRETLGTVADASEDLRTTLDALRHSSGDLRDLMEALKSSSASLRGTFAALESASGVLRDVSGILREGSAAARETSGTARAILGDVESLRGVLNRYEPTLQEALRTLDSLSGAAARAVRDTTGLISSAESLARSAGTQLDRGTQDTLSGLSSSLRKAADGLDSTQDLRNARDTISDLIEDTWDEYTGKTNNLLLMDATAEVQSLTSSRNPAPQSVQVIIRTREITASDTETADGQSRKPEAETSTVWNRLGQMFRDFWGAVTGIFHRRGHQAGGVS